MTEKEAHARNQGFALNFTKKDTLKLKSLYRKLVNWVMSTRFYKYLLKHVIPYIRFTTYYTSLRGKKVSRIIQRVAAGRCVAYDRSQKVDNIIDSRRFLSCRDVHFQRWKLGNKRNDAR